MTKFVVKNMTGNRDTVEADSYKADCVWVHFYVIETTNPVYSIPYSEVASIRIDDEKTD